jgi:hypothetical protein
MSGAIVKRHTSVDVSRLERFKAGETIEEIAEKDEVCPATVLASIQRGAARDQMLQLMRLFDMKLTGAIENELVRQQLRKEYRKKLTETIGTLLSGRRQLPITNRITGETTIIEIIDPEIMAQGVELLIEILGLKVKPAPNFLPNLQNNEVEYNEGSTIGYEERLEKIRARQSRDD